MRESRSHEELRDSEKNILRTKALHKVQAVYAMQEVHRVRFNFLIRALQRIRSMSRNRDPKQVHDAKAEVMRYCDGIEKELSPDQRRQLSEELSTLEQPNSNSPRSLPEKNPIGRLLP